MDFFRKLFYTIYWLLKISFHFDHLFHFNNLKRLIGLREHKTLIIIGNGISFNEDIEKVNVFQSDFMVVNRHVLSYSYEQLKPKFYVLADPHFFFNEEGLATLELIKTKTTWKLYLFVPSWKKSFFEVKRIFKDSEYINIVPINTLPFNGFTFLKNFLYDHNLSCPRVQNVLVAAIYIGINIKYEKIELYGVEHSWTKHLSVNNLNQVCLENPHFFNTNDSNPKTWKEIHGNDIRFCDALRAYAYMFESYWEINKIAISMDVQVVNCTPNSFIDAFERKYL